MWCSRVSTLLIPSFHLCRKYDHFWCPDMGWKRESSIWVLTSCSFFEMWFYFLLVIIIILRSLVVTASTCSRLSNSNSYDRLHPRYIKYVYSCCVRSSLKISKSQSNLKKNLRKLLFHLLFHCFMFTLPWLIQSHFTAGILSAMSSIMWYNLE